MQWQSCIDCSYMKRHTHVRQKVIARGMTPNLITADIKTYITEDGDWGHNAVRATSQASGSMMDGAPTGIRPANTKQLMQISLAQEPKARKGGGWFSCSEGISALLRPTVDLLKTVQGSVKGTHALAASSSSANTSSQYCP